MAGQQGGGPTATGDGAGESAPGRRALGLLGGINARLDELRRFNESLDRLSGELEARHAEVDARSAAVDAREAVLREHEAALAARAAELEAERADLDTRLAELDARRAELDVRDASLSGDRRAAEARAAALAEREAALTARERETAEREAALAGELAELEASLGTLAVRGAALDAQASALAVREREVQSSAAAMAGRDGALAQAQKSSADWERKATSGAARVTALEQELLAARGDLEAARRVAADATASRDAAAARCAELEHGAAQAGAGADEVAALRQALAQREQAIRRLAERLREAERGANAAAAPAPRDAARAPGAALRRARLRRMKELLRSESRKIVAARNALHRRHEQYDQLLAQRAKLADAWTMLQAKETALARTAARRGALGVAAGVLVALGALAGLSWGAAQQFAPTTYVARAVLRATTATGEPSQAQLQAWAGALGDVARDPGFIELAAERMGRRGIADMATGAALSQRLQRDLALTPTGDASLAIELRGPGTEAPRRDLETVLGALLSLASDLPAARSGGCGTAVATHPETVPEPVADARPVYAAGILGGGVVAAGILWGVVYGVLARARRHGESADALDAALDPAGWARVDGPGARRADRAPAEPGDP